MTRLYGRAPTNERVNDYVPDVRFERRSVISVLGLEGVIAPLMFNGTLDGDFFSWYIEKILTPELKTDDILILDNCSAHKVVGALDSLHDKGVIVKFLPEYSPDFNPIELMHSKEKSILRKLKARTPEELENAVREAINSVTYSDIVGWFEHDGYILNN